MPPTSPTKRPRGAPKGNFNAVKHGFYTRRIHKRDLTGVETTDTNGLIEEIALIRIFTRRLLESISPETDAYELAEFLRALCLSSSTLTRLAKTQILISQSGLNEGATLHRVLEELTEKYGLDRDKPVEPYTPVLLPDPLLPAGDQ